MSEIIDSVEVKEKAKRGPQGPIKNYVILGANLGEFELLAEYAERTGKKVSNLRTKLNEVFENDPRSTIRISHDHPALSSEVKPKGESRYIFIMPDGTAVHASKGPEGYFMYINLKERTFTNAQGTFPMPWEVGVFLGTRPVKKDKA
jgi:hypothetical protein